MSSATIEELSVTIPEESTPKENANDCNFLEKYITCVDQDRRDSEARTRQYLENLEARMREDRQQMEQRLVEERRLAEQRLEERYKESMTRLDKAIESMDSARSWIAGLFITSSIAVAGVIVAILLAIRN